MTYPYGLKNTGYPKAPDVEAISLPNAVTASWPAVPHAARYKVRLLEGDTVVQEFVTYNTTYTKTGLTPGTEYTIQVQSENVVGQSLATEQNATASPPIPGVPTNVTVTPQISSLDITWDAMDFATSYTVRVQQGSTTVSTTPKLTNSHTANGLTGGTTYTISVSATNVSGTSSYSAGVDGTPLHLVPSVPTGFTLTAGTNALTANWNSTANADHYVVKIGSSNYTTTNNTYTATGLTAGQSYTVSVQAVSDGGSSAFTSTSNVTPLPPAPATPTNLQLTPTINGFSATWNASSTATSYDVKVQNGAGTTLGTYNVVGTSYSASSLASDTSYTVSVRANNDGGSSAYTSTSNVTTTAPVPTTPTGLSTTVDSSTQISSSWNATSGASSYDVRINSGTPINVATNSYVFTGLTANTSYTVDVRANSSGGSSSYSTGVTKSTLPNAPATPTGLTVTPGTNQLAASWNASSGATSYDVRLNGGTPVNVATTSYTFTGLTAGTSYTVDVRANNSGGSSAYSSGVSNTPAAPTPTWATMTLPSSGDWRGGSYGNGKFLLLKYGTSTALTSANGTTGSWTSQTMADTRNWVASTYGNGTFVAIATGTNTVNTSSDGASWTTRNLPASGTWQTIAYGNSTFVVLGNNTEAATSSDGATWTARTGTALNGWNIVSVVYGGGKFVAVANNNTRAFTSTDGITWTTQTLSSTSQLWRNVVYGNGIYVATAGGTTDASRTTTYATSTNGTSWTTRTLPTSDNWDYGIFVNGTFYLISGGANNSSSNGLQSTDGTNWTPITYPRAGYWTAAATNGTDKAFTAQTGTAAMSFSLV